MYIYHKGSCCSELNRLLDNNFFPSNHMLSPFLLTSPSCKNIFSSKGRFLSIYKPSTGIAAIEVDTDWTYEKSFPELVTLTLEQDCPVHMFDWVEESVIQHRDPTLTVGSQQAWVGSSAYMAQLWDGVCQQDWPQWIPSWTCIYLIDVTNCCLSSAAHLSQCIWDLPSPAALWETCFLCWILGSHWPQINQTELLYFQSGLSSW